MMIERVAAGVNRAWDDFVLDHVDSTFCHLSGWSKVAQEVFGFACCNLVARQGSDITGVLPLVLVQRPLLGRALISTPFCVYGGPLTRDHKSAEALIAEALSLAETLGANLVELRGTGLANEDWAQRHAFATFSLPLVDDPTANLKLIRGRQRAVVRKAIERQLPVTTDRDLVAFYRIYQRSVQALGTPVYPLRWLTALEQVFGDMLEVTTVCHEDRSVCSVLSFYFRDQVLPYYGAGLPAARSLGAFPYLYYTLMNRAAERGCTTFDFGRSAVDSGAWHFKKNFGAIERGLPSSFYSRNGAKIPELNPNNPKLALLGRIWSRLPGPLADLAGPPLSVYAI